MTFYKFLITNKVNPILFIQNCLPEYQCFDGTGMQGRHKNLMNLIFTQSPYRWMDFAFRWARSIQRNIDWLHLNSKWIKIVGNNSEITHGFPTFKEF